MKPAQEQTQIFYPQSATEMEALGAWLAQRCLQGLVTLHGDLGVGKTTLVRGWLHQLGHTGTVKSPTYTLVEPYSLGKQEVYHFDLYRLSDAEELEYIGIRDYLRDGSLCLVEWPERAIGLLGQPNMNITLHYQGNQRKVEIQLNQKFK